MGARVWPWWPHRYLRATDGKHRGPCSASLKAQLARPATALMTLSSLTVPPHQVTPQRMTTRDGWVVDTVHGSHSWSRNRCWDHGPRVLGSGCRPRRPAPCHRNAALRKDVHACRQSSEREITCDHHQRTVSANGATNPRETIDTPARSRSSAAYDVTLRHADARPISVHTSVLGAGAAAYYTSSTKLKTKSDHRSTLTPPSLGNFG